MIYKYTKIFYCQNLKETYPDFVRDHIDISNKDHCWVLCKIDENGNPIDTIGWDGGEPEDQCLVRDWQWIQTVVENYETKINSLLQENELLKELLSVEKEKCH